jgi:putative transposase
LDEAHLRNAIRYVELNPVRAGLVARAEDYPWSSAPAHCNGAEDPVLSRRCIAPDDGASWSAWLAKGLSDDDLESIRSNTSTGRPTAVPEAIRWLELHLGRTIQPRRRG